ncbi:ribosomal large subunit pseudouridine synthase A [Advenella kashmirensis W13003]|uniref:Ribosomal large subunit pseudouridine synthase A n=1 Tax=Advenella kashmirensis W13003 TaxID=1424334 RepID=V8QTX4_9BURK|nr:pseudouridine synthase [Advenella kashmirensis]ETF02798.1 ribosomal large subunit pseudouridine synthase A [Advenella kashmirensis W13003]
MSVLAPLPVKNGVAPSRVYLPRETWPDLISFLLHKFPHMDADVLRERLGNGDMVDTTGKPYALNSPFVPDSWLWYYREVPVETVVPFDIDILYQDELLIAIDKPHFMASIPGGRHLHQTALVRLRDQLGNPHINPIHRLDRDTAGVLVFCTDRERRGLYQSLFQTRSVHKIYEAVAPWHEDLEFPLVRESLIRRSGQVFVMHEIDGTPNSRTRIQLLSHNRSLGHYRLEPVTGRKHQLRVHMNALGIPICNDEYYPVLQPLREQETFENPLQLLARSMQFIDPVTGIERYFESRRELDMVAQIRE